MLHSMTALASAKDPMHSNFYTITVFLPSRISVRVTREPLFAKPLKYSVTFISRVL